MTTIDVIFCLLCIYGVIGLCYILSNILSDSIKQFFSRTSGNVNAIYIIQWFLIPLTYIFIVFFNRDIIFNDISLIIIALLEIIASTALAAGYKKYLKNFKGVKKI
jgi:hypothetical protein